MKCALNITNKVFSRSGVESTIHQSMSYRDIIENVIFTNEKYGSDMFNAVRTCTVHYKDKLTGAKLYGFIDLSSIKAFAGGEKQLCLSPVTTTLLERYGVTWKQFLEDFHKEETASCYIP